MEGVLAHVDIKGPYRVGRYGVNLEDLDAIAVPSLVSKSPQELIVIDEIGKMELFSPLFKETLIKALDSENRVIASVALKGDRFIQRIKSRNDVHLIRLTEKNRDNLVDKLCTAL